MLLEDLGDSGLVKELVMLEGEQLGVESLELAEGLAGSFCLQFGQ